MTAITQRDYTGQQFGDFAALRKSLKPHHWFFTCKCGTVIEHKIYSVLSGHKVPICDHLPTLREQFKSTYDSWSQMVARCVNMNNHAFKDYGDRGICVSENWLTYPEGFQQFIKDVGVRPDGLTLERSDVHKGYSPDNCTWVSKADQNRNKQYHRMISYNGVTKPLFQWVKDLGLNYYTTHSRLYKGHSVEFALFGAVKKRSK